MSFENTPKITTTFTDAERIAIQQVDQLAGIIREEAQSEVVLRRVPVELGYTGPR